MSTIRTSAQSVFTSLLRREEFSSFGFTYGRMPPAEAHHEVLVSEQNVIDFAFLPNPKAIIEYEDGRTASRNVPALRAGGTGTGTFGWVKVPEPSEFVEIRIRAEIRRQVAEEANRIDLTDLEEVIGINDPSVFAASFRLRAHTLGGKPVSELEADQMALTIMRNRVTYLGGKLPRRVSLGLDRRRLERVVDYMAVHYMRALTVQELADVAAVSRHHFSRMFKRTTGQSPHAYLTAYRMQRAFEKIYAGQTVSRTAKECGYVSGHQFRRAFWHHFGTLPGRRRL